MSSGMKYIVYDHTELVIFPASMDHAMFARRLGLDREQLTSAGFVSGNELNQPYCHGRSHGLDLDSRPEVDTRVLRRYLGS